MMAAESVEGRRLSLLLKGLADIAAAQDLVVTGLCIDSRKVQHGDLFLACAGRQAHGLDFAAQAVQAGAVALLWEPVAGVAPNPEWVRRLPCIPVPDLSGQLGVIADRFYGHPSRDMAVIGITGTNGKTSVSRFIAHALEAAGKPCGVMGTLGCGRYQAVPAVTDQARAGVSRQHHQHTTPDAVSVHGALARMHDDGLRHVAMEVSSHALDQGRVNAVAFDVAVWTNLSRDHLDYHGDMRQYAEAKHRLFAWNGLRAVVINADDEAGRELIMQYPQAVRYGLGATVAGEGRFVRGVDLQLYSGGLRMNIVSSWGGATLEAPVLAAFNASNLLAALAVLLVLDIPLAEAVLQLSDVAPVPGRMECFGGGEQPRVVVDYAHTPDALEKVLAALREHTQNKLWCVFGCGGERDSGKRPLMAAVAERYADSVVITEDNPRHEDLQQILADICAGMKVKGHAVIERDRARAIAHAVSHAQSGDVVLVAGKGHENYQLVGDERHVFSDRVEVERCLTQTGTGRRGRGHAMSLAQAVEILHAIPVNRTLPELSTLSFSQVSTDTRTLDSDGAPGSLFVALQGARFDAHAYLAQAADKGALAALVSRDWLETNPVQPDLPLLAVEDTRLALGKLASAWRQQFDIPLVAVTGSNGKTTVKEMLAAILGQCGRVLATQGNLNNDIGVPQTLFHLNEKHDFAVIEMGANHPGEIAYLTALARPSVALITNAAPAHLEGFGSLQGVAQAKGEIYRGLGPDGVAVINADDPHAGLWQQQVDDRRCLRFGFSADAEVRASTLVMQVINDGGIERLMSVFEMQLPQDTVQIRLPLVGHHNVMNALCAAAAALAMGAQVEQIRQGLESMVPVAGRLQLKRGPNGARLIDDSYNANPASLHAGIEAVEFLPGETWLVLGDMGELGDEAVALHAEAGRQARERGVQRLFTLGSLTRHSARAFGEGACHFHDVAALVDALAPLLGHDINLLIKGSRSMHLEQVVQALAERGEG